MNKRSSFDGPNLKHEARTKGTPWWLKGISLILFSQLLVTIFRMLFSFSFLSLEFL